MARRRSATKKGRRKPHHAIIHEEFPILNRGDRVPDDLAKAVGYTLTLWEQVDEYLAMIFGLLVQSKHSAAEAAYGTINGFGQRCSMIREAAKKALPPPSALLTDLMSTLADIEALSAKRNNVAHGIISQYLVHWKTSDRKPRPKASGFFLVPPRYNTRKQISPDKVTELFRTHPDAMQKHRAYAYTSKQVMRFHRVLRLYLTKCHQLYVAIGAEISARGTP